jgi:hypothetical protein
LPTSISLGEQLDHAKELVKSSRIYLSILSTFGVYAITAVWFAQPSDDGLFDLQLIGLRMRKADFLVASGLLMTALFVQSHAHLQGI